MEGWIERWKDGKRDGRMGREKEGWIERWKDG